MKADLKVTVVSCMMDIAEILKAAKKVKFILIGEENLIGHKMDF